MLHSKLEDMSLNCILSTEFFVNIVQDFPAGVVLWHKRLYAV